MKNDICEHHIRPFKMYEYRKGMRLDSSLDENNLLYIIKIKII